jgi:hypothetical protein
VCGSRSGACGQQGRRVHPGAAEPALKRARSNVTSGQGRGEHDKRDTIKVRETRGRTGDEVTLSVVQPGPSFTPVQPRRDASGVRADKRRRVPGDVFNACSGSPLVHVILVSRRGSVNLVSLAAPGRSAKLLVHVAPCAARRRNSSRGRAGLLRWAWASVNARRHSRFWSPTHQATFQAACDVFDPQRREIRTSMVVGRPMLLAGTLSILSISVPLRWRPVSVGAASAPPPPPSL